MAQEHEEAETEDIDYDTPAGKLSLALKYEFLSSSTERTNRSRSASLNPETLSTCSFTRVRSSSITPEQNTKSQSNLEMPKFGGRSSLPLPSLSAENISKTTGRLHIRVMNAEDLPPIDSTGDTNPFVRCYLLPSNGVKGKRKTSVIPKSLDPVWEEECTYKMVKFDDLWNQALEVSVWDSDRRGSNNFIGGLRIGPAPPSEGEGPEWMDSTGEEVTQWEEMLANPGMWVERTHDLRPSMASRVTKKTELQLDADEDATVPQDEVSTELKGYAKGPDCY